MRKPAAGIRTLKDSPPELDGKLVQGYLDTTYRIPSLDNLDVRIGQQNPALDRHLEKMGAANFTFITAWNPRSTPFPAAENAQCNAALAAQLDAAAQAFFPALGIGDRGDYPPEDGFVAFGISVEKALALAVDFGQNAIVFGEKGDVAELWATRIWSG